MCIICSVLGGGLKSEKMDYQWGWEMGVLLKKCQEQPFVSDNEREAITESWSHNLTNHIQL